MTMKFELGLDFLTVHLPTKFHRPMFNRSEIIMLTNADILLKTSTSLHYATPVEKNTVYRPIQGYFEFVVSLMTKNCTRQCR